MQLGQGEPEPGLDGAQWDVPRLADLGGCHAVVGGRHERVALVGGQRPHTLCDHREVAERADDVGVPGELIQRIGGSTATLSRRRWLVLRWSRATLRAMRSSQAVTDPRRGS
jgi:hypothetical protein